MNDKTTTLQPRPMPGLRTAMCWALVLSSMISTPLLAAQTDISTAPITSTNAAQVKPNIMLLMDTSGSMGWGHMPDEVETEVGIGAIGYKAAQCNALYYNRTLTYAIPKLASGLLFPTPPFGAAPYDPFDTTSTTVVNLANAFKAYDDSTLRTSGYNDTPQPAYYYYKTGGTVPITAYNSSPCLDTDVNMTVASSDGGTWTRVVVSSSSGLGGTDERQNFANWYSYYRTRILLTKSAASLAFTPLTDSFRVGFITVKPKDSPSAAAINPAKYLAIDDFGTSQRGLWFDKLFSQKPSGSSPTREGLARVGRHYAGMHDGINQGMPEDPVQYSCQQNFTIMTTDGYWNAQDESTGLSGGYIGGPVDMSGKALVGQADGTLNALTNNHPSPAPAADFNGTPRPIWDGTFDGLRTVRTKTVHDAYQPCGTYFSMSTTQASATTAQLLKTTSQTTQSTVQNLRSQTQNLQSTTQMLQTTTQTTQSTVENVASTQQNLQSTTQRLKSTSQITTSTVQNRMATQQNLQSTVQNLQSTSQSFMIRTHTDKTVSTPRQSTSQTLQSTVQNRRSTSQQTVQTVQNLKATSQNLQSTSQTNKSTTQTTQSTVQNLQSTVQSRKATAQTLQSTSQTTQSTSQTTQSTSQQVTSTSQLQITTSQVRRSTSQIRSCDSSTELCTPGPVGSCTNGGTISCEVVTTGPTLVASCTAAAASSANNWTATTCATSSSAPTPAGACTAQPASASNSYTTTSCNTASTPPTPTNSCNPATANAGNAYTTTTCSTAVSGPTPVQSCTASSPTAANAYTTTTCAPVTTGPTGVASCSPQTASAVNSWQTVTCGTNNTSSVPVQTCTAATAAAANSYTTTTCTPNNTAAAPVQSCTSASPTSANNWVTTTCTTNSTSNVPVQSCTAVTATSANSWTTTSCSTNNTTNVPSGTCTPITATSANNWTTTTCPTVGTGPTPVSSCSGSTGNSTNSWVTTTCSTATTTSVPVQTCTGASASSSNNWTTTSCSTNNTSATPVATCTGSSATSANNWTTTTCTNNTSAATPVASCSTVAASSANNYTATNCPVVTTTNVPVASCTAATANSGNSYTTTTCPSPVTTSNVPVASCTTATASSSNNYTATNCSTATTSNVAVNSCTASGPTSANNYVTTTCPAETLVSGPTTVASCTSSPATDANNHQRTDCNTTADSTPVQFGTCVASAASASNGYVATTCNTVTATNVPVASCTPQTAASSNSWLTINCGTNNTTNVPVATCTASSASSANAYTTTTCPAPITTGPTPVASCTADPATSANNYVATTCPAPITTGPTGASSCVNIPASSANNWTSTVCGNPTTSNVPVSSCTNAAAASGNSWTSTVCTDNNTTAVPVATCSPQTAAAGNNWTGITCPSPLVTTNVPVASCTNDSVPSASNNYKTTTCGTNNTTNVPSGTCSASGPTAQNGWTTTTCPVLTTGPAGVATCSGATANSGNAWTTTTCTPNNTTNVPVASCTGSSATSANGYTTTTCSTHNTTNVPVASCSSGSPTLGNGYTTTTCSTNNTTNVPSGSCVAISPTSANGYTTTTCPVIVVGPVGSAACTSSTPSAANNWTTTTCPGTNSTGPTPVTSCTATLPDSTNSFTSTSCTVVSSTPTVVTSCNPAAANAGNNYTATICTPLNGNQLTVTTYTRVQQYNTSGGVQSSTGTDVTTTDGPTASGACYAPGAQPALPPDGYATWTSADATAYPSCSGWPCSIDTPSGNPRSINSLADVAQYYYVNDLRTPANEPRGPNYYRDDVPGVGSGPEDDQARWQHMTTFSIALGVSGTLNYQTDYKTAATGDFADIRSGAKNWPLWPDPSPGYYNDAAAYNDPRSIDDFWHAAVNGRGIFFSAANPTSVIAGLSGALAGINSRVASSTGAGTSNLEPVAGDNFVYLANYTTQKWTGDVQSHTIDVATGLINAPVIWSAQGLLDASTGNLCDNRTIKLFDAGATDKLTDFSWSTSKCDLNGNPAGSIADGLSSGEQANFGALNVSLMSQYPSMTPGQRTAAAGANLVNFLRGQRGYENFSTTDTTKLYRQRDHVLGDIVDGQPVYVRAPFASYTDTGYAAFKVANAGRTPMLYVAANDGMLHAFYAGTSETDTQGGKEAWAVIPSAVLPNLYKLADANYKNVHQYYVDGTPTVSDVFDGSSWRTLLVGGLNDGGRGFYALDVTDPVHPKGMWEFNWSDTCYNGNPSTAGADCQLGLSFGHPLVTKLSTGRWVVMVTSGYNNVNATPKPGDGGGYLYVLDAVTGQIIYKIATNVGDATTPSGLAQINDFVDKADINNLAVRVYGTDTLGNIWRFDVNDNTAPSGREATLVGTAKDAAGIAQPITTRPELTSVGDNPMLFVATGKLLGASDVADVQTQTIYGIVDPVTPTVAYSDLRAALAPLTMTQVGSGTGAYRTINCTGTTAQCASTAGWRVDLPDLGERVNVEMKLRDQVLIVGSNVPQISACSAGGYSWLNYLSYQSGLAVTTSPGLSVSEQVANSLIVGLTVVILGDNTVKAIVTTSDAGVLTRTIPTPTVGSKARRVSWREVIAQ